MTRLYSWQQPQWLFLSKLFATNHLPHALLLHGAAGVGKCHLAQLFTQYILCRDKQADRACGQCKECRLLQAGNHPDLLQLCLEDNEKTIKIDALRAVLKKFTQKSHQQGYKIIIINPAEAMNRASANALLKTLEEPGEQSLILLISHDMSQLPATVRSRCQVIYCPTVDHAETQRYLQSQGLPDDQVNALSHYCQGAPLQALALWQSDYMQQRQQLLNGLVSIFQAQIHPISLAQNCHQYELKWLLDCFAKWIIDIICWQYQQQTRTLYNSDYQTQIAAISQRLHTVKLYQLLDSLYQAQRILNAKINLNSQLFLEDLFCQWARVFTMIEN